MFKSTNAPGTKIKAVTTTTTTTTPTPTPKAKIKLVNASKSKLTAANVPTTKIKSGLKYIYLTAFFMLLSGFFHPLITETSFESVIIGTLILFLGLAGGILLYEATVSRNRRLFYLGGGFGLITVSAFSIFQLAGQI